ncbi:MAG: hypothetical protein GXO22_04110 [Aquificae bacterium]|nr:hypothetical protein [Aquificota bacterium]
MEKITVGSVKFLKPVVEKVIDIYYLVDENEHLKHTYTILTYDEMDKDYQTILKEKGILDSSPKLVVVDETIVVNFGDEELEKHFDSVILYDEEWIYSKNPNQENFEDWLIKFTDQLLFGIRKKKA